MRSAYHNSDMPGQRAARVLSSKLTNFKADEEGVLLDEADLAVVEKGKNDMRQLTDFEQSLVCRSQEKQKGLWEQLKYLDNNVTLRLQKLGYYDKYKNPNGKGIEHQYKPVKQHGKKLVFGYATGLIWQRSGSMTEKNSADAEKYIINLNNKKFAGFDDWRLPTLEETMSLMEPKKNMACTSIHCLLVVCSSLYWLFVSGH